MSNNNAQASNISTLALQYGINTETLRGWIMINPELYNVVKPYWDMGKKTLPPQVVKKIYEVLGEP